MSASVATPARPDKVPSGKLLGTRAALFHLWRGALPEAPVVQPMVSGVVGARFAPALTAAVQVEVVPLVPQAESAADRQQRLRDALFDDIFLF